MIVHRRGQTYLYRLAGVCFVIGAVLFAPRSGRAEVSPGSPFGTMDGTVPPPPPPPSDATEFQPEEDDFGDQGGGFGFGGSPPPPNENNPPSSAPSNSPPTRLTTTPATRGTPPPPAGTPSGKGRSAPKLADYLELEPAVRGLEVKNFDLPDKDIKDVVSLISKWTGKNFILDSKVRGKITIIGPSQVTLQEAYEAFLSALDANGLTTIQSGRYIRIIESAEARRSPVKTYAGDYAPKDDQFITRIFQLKYINSDEVEREFRDLTTRQGKLFAYEPTNSIIITDTGSNIERIKEILTVLDVKGFETTLHVLRIQNSSAKAIAEMLGEIYGDKGNANGPRTFRRSALERTRGGGVIAKIIPDEATNSLVVLANQAGFESLTRLVDKLDVKVADTGRIHVYYCEYAKAEDLASTLAALTGGSGKSSSTRSSTPSSGSGSTTTSPASSGPVSAELEGGVKVTSDTATNSLVITANSSDYQTLKKVIKKLDIPRLQVFVESALLEIDISDSDQIGVTAAIGAPGIGFAGGFVGNGSDLANYLTGALPPATGATIPFLVGQTVNATGTINGQTYNYPVRSFMGLLKLITQNANSTILSTPQIIALDNEKAEFKVQDETPVQTSFTSTIGSVPGSTGVGTGNIDRLKTGVQIKLTPHVNASSGNIRLEIEQQVDNIKNSTSAGTPSAISSVNVATTSRVANTQVVVHDQDYVILGGLMEDKVDDTVVKVPLLGDIPILGWLFKSKTHNISKTNLVLLLHPKIIGTTLAAANQVNQSLDERQRFINKYTNGEDEYADEVKGLKQQMKRQIERGREERVYDYRNNDEDEPKPPPGEQSELDGHSGSNSKSNDTSQASSAMGQAPGPEQGAGPTLGAGTGTGPAPGARTPPAAPALPPASAPALPTAIQ